MGFILRVNLAWPEASFYSFEEKMVLTRYLETVLRPSKVLEENNKVNVKNYSSRKSQFVTFCDIDTFYLCMTRSQFLRFALETCFMRYLSTSEPYDNFLLQHLAANLFPNHDFWNPRKRQNLTYPDIYTFYFCMTWSQFLLIWRENSFNTLCEVCLTSQ